MADEQLPQFELIDATVEIVTAYLSQNKIDAAEVPALITSVHGSLAGLGGPVAEPVEEVEKPTAAQIRKSQTGDHLISFIDGKPYKSLRRHLTTNGFTPESYRERYGLPASYPMVAPSYSAARSALAKQIGLGAKGRAAPTKGRGRKAS